MSAENKSPREELRSQISKIPGIFEGDSGRWWFKAYKFLRQQENEFNKLSPEIQSSISPYLAMALDLVRKEVGDTNANNEADDLSSAHRAEAIIMKISYEMAKRFEPEIDDIRENRLSIDEILKAKPDMFRLRGSMFGIKLPDGENYYEVKLPDENTIWYKGGVSRLVLNILAGAKQEVIMGDLPPNDHDGIAIGDFAKAHELATQMGIDADGLEMWKGKELDFARFCLGRDSTQNQVMFGRDGIHFSDAAMDAAESGYTEIVGKYIPEKAIYGVDVVYLKGAELAKPRGQMRLIKALSEGKILSFEHKPLSNNMDVSLYVMFLAKRWSKKENFTDLMQNMFEVLKRMGHVREGEKNIFQVLKRAHTTYPFFDFDSEVKDITEVVRWKSRKIVKQIDREFAWQYPNDIPIDLERAPNDTVPVKITLEGFSPKPEIGEWINDKWKKYLEHSRREFREYQNSDLSSVERMFKKADKVDFEDMGLGSSESGMFVEGRPEI